jgi:geranylgeranyl diphosphate synthase type II
LLHGEDTAILVGDALLSEAFALLYQGYKQGDYVAEIFADLCQRITKACGASGMVAGQYLDMLLSKARIRFPLEFEEEQELLLKLQEMHLLKTGALFAAPFTMAAVIIDPGEAEAEKLAHFGALFGLVFQIQDDLLDLYGDPQIMGKSVAKDKVMGKLTYVTLLGENRTKEILNEKIVELQKLAMELASSRNNLMLLINLVSNRQS